MNTSRGLRIGSVAVALVAVAVAVAVAALSLSSDPDDVPLRERTTYEADLPDIQVDSDARLSNSRRGVQVTGDSWSSLVSWWDEDRPVTSFGVYLCVVGGGDAVIRDVAPLQVMGSGFELVGVALHEVVSGGDSVELRDGFPPPDAAGRFRPAEGAALTDRCGGPVEGWNELVVGLRATSPAGGGWRGIAITYTTEDGTERRLYVPQELLMCGTATEPCGGTGT